MTRENSGRHAKDRNAPSGYTNGKRAIPTEGEDRNESVYRNPVGAQSGAPLEGQHDVETGPQEGGARSPRHARSTGHPHHTVPQQAAFEGSVRSRVVEDPGRQGISSSSSAKEAEGQRKVVSERPDAQAGVNHSSRKRAA